MQSMRVLPAGSLHKLPAPLTNSAVRQNNRSLRGRPSGFIDANHFGIRRMPREAVPLQNARKKEPLHARCDRTGMEGLLSQSVVVADAYFSEA